MRSFGHCPDCGGEVPPLKVSSTDDAWTRFHCETCGLWSYRSELVHRPSLRVTDGYQPPVATADFGTGPDYPRPWCYVESNGNGGPILVGASLSKGGTFDSSVIASIAKFPMVTINTTPFSDLHTEIVGMLKAINPRIIIAW